jgi:hypothetical protein
VKRNIWFALRRPVDKTRTGLLCIWPQEKCCIYLSGDRPTAKSPGGRTALLRLRIDPQFLTGTGLTVFAASLTPSDRALWIEDTLVWKGRDVFSEESFQKRWLLAAQWLEHYCILDPRLVGGLNLIMAPWVSLSSMQSTGVWEIQQDDPGRHRFLWIASETDRPEKRKEKETEKEPETEPIHAPSLEDGPLIVVAKKEDGPDQWSLTSSDGVSLGRALVRTMALSSALRSSKKNTLNLEVAWNTQFQKWEARAIVSDSLVASHSGSFNSGVDDSTISHT